MEINPLTHFHAIVFNVLSETNATSFIFLQFTILQASRIKGYSQTFQKDRALVFKTNYRLMQVKSIEGEHSAILLTVIKLPFLIKICVLSFLNGRFTHVLLYVCLLETIKIIHFDTVLG